MSILSVDQIQPIGSGTTITLNATEVKTGTEITVGTGASIFSPAGNTLTLGTNNTERLRITNAGALGLSGTNYGSSGQVLTSAGSGSAPTWSAIPAQVTIANNADNRVITGGSGVNLNGEAGLTYNGQQFKVETVTSENNAFRLFNTTTSATTFQINGEGNSFIGHTYPRSDANLDLGYHSGYRWRDVVLNGGIRFGNNSSGNYLDDYEEGSWNPTYTSQGGSAGSVSYSNQMGFYVKIGHTVWVCIELTISSASGMTGNACIGNHPFNSNPRGSGSIYYYSGTSNWYIENHAENKPIFTGWMPGNTNLFRIHNGTHWGSLPNAPLNTTGRLSFSHWYTTDS